MKNYLLFWKNLSKIIQCILFVTCIVINIITINAYKPYFFYDTPPPPTITKCASVKNNPLQIIIYKNLKKKNIFADTTQRLSFVPVTITLHCPLICNVFFLMYFLQYVIYKYAILDLYNV